MRAASLVCLLLATSFIAAGCVDAPADEPTSDDDTVFDLEWSRAALVAGEGHDHTDPLHHQNLSTPNFEILGHDPLVSQYYGQPAGSHFCGDATQTAEGRRIAVAESRSDVAFTLADVTDPREPFYLGELVMRHTYVYDLAITPSAEYVVLTTAQPRTPELDGVTRQAADAGAAPDADTPDPLTAGTPAIVWRSPCVPGGEVVLPLTVAQQDPLPRPAMNVLVDITDPSEPRIVDQVPAGGLGHSVFATEVQGREVALVSVYGRQEDTSTFQFYEVERTAAGARLALLSVYSVQQNQDPTSGPNRQSGHNDGWIANHPVTGQDLAYLGNWDAGVHLLDLADLRSPTFVGAWEPPGGTSGRVHSVYPLPTLRNGTHYTLVGPEWENRPSDDLPTGVVYVLDTTDPAAPREVAGWTLPHDVEWSGRLMYSNHYLSAVNDTMFVSMYHGGVWAVDLTPVRPEGFVSLPSIGVFMPALPPEQEAAVKNRWAPTQEEVLAMPDGTLVTFDANSGVYTFRFDGDRPAPAPEPWPLEPVTWTR